MSNDFTIRAATPDDAPQLHRLICELARYEKVDPATTVKSTPESLAQQMRSDFPPFSALVAQVGDELVGLALYFYNYSTWTGKRGVYLEDLFVEEKVRKFGIGKALLLQVAHVARSQGAARMDWAVLDWNQPARAFYESLGARCLEEWRIYRFDATALDGLEKRASHGVFENS
jgi:GNAT superfamily N-acetyltransferase